MIIVLGTINLWDQDTLSAVPECVHTFEVKHVCLHAGKRNYKLFALETIIVFFYPELGALSSYLINFILHFLPPFLCFYGFFFSLSQILNAWCKRECRQKLYKDIRIKLFVHLPQFSVHATLI